MIKSDSTARPPHARRPALAAALMLSVALAALLLAPPAAPRTQDGAARARQGGFEVKQGDKKTEIKLVSERGELTKVTATDPAGTRSFKPLDKLTIPCKEEQMECKTVENEWGTPVGVCYCPDTQTALLLPAVQKVREAAARSKNTNTNTNTNTNSGGSGGGITKIGPGTLTLGGASAAGAPHVKVFSGATGAELTRRCWGDEKLKLIICPQ